MRKYIFQPVRNNEAKTAGDAMAFLKKILVNKRITIQRPAKDHLNHDNELTNNVKCPS